MDELIKSYVYQTENPFINHDMASLYHNNGEYASAISFYIKCKDRTDDINLQYSCLIKSAECFKLQGKKDYVVKKLLLDALNLCPENVEAKNLLYTYGFDEPNWYAQFDTDKYIRTNFFPDYTYRGIYVEVGAGPPTFISNSKHFRDTGWRTIGVDPNPKFVEQHRNEGSEIYQYACSNEEKMTSFIINLNNDSWYSEENDGVSFSALEIRHEGVPDHNTQQVISVETIRLDTLLRRLELTRVDVLSVDVEGWELEVIDGFNCSYWKPKVIVLENHTKDPKYDNFMLNKGYVKSAELAWNFVYVRANE